MTSLELNVYADTPNDAELDKPWPAGSGPFADRQSDGQNRLPKNYDYTNHPSNNRDRKLTEAQKKAAEATWNAWDKKKLGPIPKSALEDFPTAPWVYRGLCENVLGGKGNLHKFRCLEPACGRMYSSDTLWEYFKHVRSSDIGEYGFGARYNFLDKIYKEDSFDWVITNPPFSHWDDFALEALRVASQGVALLGPLSMLCTTKRYKSLYRSNPLSIVAGMVERVHIRDEFVVDKSGQPIEYAWFIWLKQHDPNVKFVFQVPPCRASLERTEDYIYRI